MGIALAIQLLYLSRVSHLIALILRYMQLNFIGSTLVISKLTLFKSESKL